MSKHLSSILAAAALAAFTGPAAAQSACESMNVIVRNGVYDIQNLGAFCAEFNKMKSELAGMKKALSEARERNDLLEARLAARYTGDIASPARYPQFEDHSEE